MEKSIEEVKERMKEICKEVDKEIVKMLVLYTDKRFIINTRLKRSESRKLHSEKRSYMAMDIDICFVNSVLNEIFGSSFSIYWEDGTLTMNHGSMGSFDREKNALADRCIMMGNIWMSYGYVENILRMLDLKFNEEYLKLSNIKEEFYEEQEKIKREEKFAEWLNNYKGILGNMTYEELQKERRRRKTSHTKYNNVSPRVLDAIELEWDLRK